ncbi:MAG: glycosyl hydrolase family 28-related protein [Actinomycetota bacterium]
MGIPFSESVDLPRVDTTAELTAANSHPEGRIAWVSNVDKIYASNGSAWAELAAQSGQLPSYTVATLPAAGTAGRLARVTDGIRGVWIDTGTQWHSITGHADVRDFGAVGDGVADDTAAIQAAINSLTGVSGEIFLPNGSYLISAPLVVTARMRLRGIGSGGTTFGASRLVAALGFTGVALIKNDVWDSATTEWWHWSSIEDLVLDCKNVAANGIAIHQMGEQSTIRRVGVYAATEASYLLTGVHAPATLEFCSAWGPGAYGFKFTTHPGARSVDGTGGVVRLIGPSGDSTVVGSTHFYFDGSQKVTAIGIKSEQWPIGISWQGAGTGGAAGAGLFSGYFNGVTTKTNLVTIGGTARPQLVFAGLHANAYTNIITDSVASVTIAAASYQQLLSWFVYNGTTVLAPQQIVLERALEAKTPAGALATILKLETNTQLQFTAFATGDGAVGGTGGLALRASDGTLLMHLRKTANGGIDVSQRIDMEEAVDIAVGTATGTKIGTAPTQKLSLWNATPVVQPTAVADATDAASVITQLNALLARLRTVGLIAT